ncbi:uncharacterized protein LOC133522560 [Cydia pomonella]|uniref:uncharacterized protein LOC133522560 n=1 Tax=Cydia pomonella TaxID=82600 RepID=UPI002ADE241C|nr:uncharacterized protein LOC133522560 [Cydia pomonella]
MELAFMLCYNYIDFQFSVSNIKFEASGKERLMFTVDKQTCNSWAGRIFLLKGNFQYSSEDCLVKKGFAGFNGVDLNKHSNDYPTWVSTGRFIERLGLVHNGTSVFCFELLVWIRKVK